MFVEPPHRCPMIDRLRREGARGPWLAILGELVRLAGPQAQFVRHREKPWASPTFSGARHSFALTFTGVQAVAAGESFIAALPDHEFELRGRLVADATVVAAEHSLLGGPRLAIEAELLVLDEA